MGATQKQDQLQPSVTVGGNPVSTAAANANAPHLDPHLMALGRQHGRLYADYEAARQVTAEAYEEYKRRLPEPVYITASDARVFAGLHNAAGREASWACEYLKKWLAHPHLRTSTPTAEARARALIDVAEAQERTEADVARVTGLAAAGEREDDLYEQLCAVEAIIVEADCTTLGGLVIKARVARRLLPDMADVENDWRDTAALSVIDALLRLSAREQVS